MGSQARLRSSSTPSSFKDGTPIYVFHQNAGGVWLDEGYRVANGDAMYRDFFQYLVPGLVHLNAGLILSFGATIAPFNWAVIGIGTVLALQIHASCGTSGRPWRFLAPWFFLVCVYASGEIGSHKWPALVCALTALALLPRREHRPLRYLMSGAAAGFAVLFTQDFGVGTALGILAYVFTVREAGANHAGEFRVKALLLLAGIASPTVLALGWFGTQAGFHTIFYDWVVFPWVQYRHYARFFVLIDWRDFVQPTRALQLLIPALGLIGSALFLAGRPRSLWARLTRPEKDDMRLFALVGLCLIMGTAHRGIFPQGIADRSVLLAILAFKLLGLMTRTRRPARVAASWAAILVGLGLIHGSLGLVLVRQNVESTTSSPW